MTQISDFRIRRKLTLTLEVCTTWLLLLVGGWMSPTFAADPPSAAATPPNESKPAAQKPAGDKPAADKSETAKPDADAAQSKSPPPKSGKSTGSPQRFEPSERVRPDFDVSFPIDI